MKFNSNSNFKLNLKLKTKLYLKYIIVSLIVILNLSLNGCFLFRSNNQTTTIDTKTINTNSYLDNENITDWNLIGKINIINNDKSDTFNINWLQKNDNFDINITNILGFKVMQITGNNNEVTLNIIADIPAKGIYTSNSIHDLVLTKFNLDLPFDDILYWIKGMPTPTSFRMIFNSNDYSEKYIKHLYQNDYLISYSEYNLINNYYLPLKFKITNEDTQNVVNFYIKSWQLNN